MTGQALDKAQADSGRKIVQRAPRTPCERLPDSVRSKAATFQQAVSEGRVPSEAAQTARLSDCDASALDEAIQDVTTRLQEAPEGHTEPTNIERVRALLGWLSDRVAWPAHLAQDPAEAERKAEVLAEDLAELPLECVAKAVREYPKRQRFWPSATADLFEPAEEYQREMRNLRGRLQLMRRLAASEWQAGRDVGAVRYSTPDAAERRRQSENRRSGAEAQSASEILARIRGGQDDDANSGGEAEAA